MAYTYTVVEPDEAHVVVFMGSGRKIYTPRTLEKAETHGSSYLNIPVLMKRRVMPMANIKLTIEDFELQDEKAAPFLCNIACWLTVSDPAVAIEKLEFGEDETFTDSVENMLTPQVQAIARAAAMKQEILDIMRNRDTFSASVEKEVNGSLSSWGLSLAKLDIIAFKDAPDSSVIADYQDARESQIRSSSRQTIAEQEKLAEIKEAEAKAESGKKQAESEKAIEVAQALKRQEVEIAEKKADEAVAKQEELANKQLVEAKRTIEVGQAEVRKEAIVKEAEGQAQATRERGTAEADVVKLKGSAEAEIIQKTGEAEAIATDKKAEALKKYNDAGITLETIKATVEIKKSQYENMSSALAGANVNLVQGGESKLLGLLDVGPEQGAAIGQFMEAMRATGTTVEDVTSTVSNIVKEVTKKK